MTVLNVKIVSPLAEMIEEMVAEGRYASAEDAVADALSRLQVEERESGEYTAQLHAKVLRGFADLDAGRVVDLDLDEIYAEALARADKD